MARAGLLSPLCEQEVKVRFGVKRGLLAMSDRSALPPIATNE